MRIGDLNSGSARLHVALKNLLLRWEQTKEVWTDQTSRTFEEEHLVPIEPQVKTTLETIGRLAEVLDKAQRECE